MRSLPMILQGDEPKLTPEDEKRLMQAMHETRASE